MSDIFVDGVRAVAVANGVARVELLQLRRGADGTKLEPEVVATLLVPAGSLRDLATHLMSSVEKMEAREKAAAPSGPQPRGDVDAALENL